MADLAQDPLSARKAFDGLPTYLSAATPENIANLIKLKQAQIEAQTVLQNTQPGMMMVNPAFDEAQQKAMQAQDAFDAAYNGMNADGKLAVTNFIAANAATETRFQKDLSEMPGVGDIAPGITAQSAPTLFQLAALKDGITQADQTIMQMNMDASMAGQILDMPAYTAAMQARTDAETKFRDSYNTLSTNGQLADVQTYLDSNRLTFVQRIGRNAGLMGDGVNQFTQETAAGLVSLPGLIGDGANWLTGHRLYDGSAGTASYNWAMGGINWLNTHDVMGNEVSGQLVENKTANEVQTVDNVSTALTIGTAVMSIPGAVRGGASLLASGGRLLETATPALTTTAKIAEAAPAAEIVIPAATTTATTTTRVAPAVSTLEDAWMASMADARTARTAANANRPSVAFQAAAAEEMPAAASIARDAAADAGLGAGPTVAASRIASASEAFAKIAPKGEPLNVFQANRIFSRALSGKEVSMADGMSILAEGGRPDMATRLFARALARGVKQNDLILNQGRTLPQEVSSILNDVLTARAKDSTLTNMFSTAGAKMSYAANYPFRATASALPTIATAPLKAGLFAWRHKFMTAAGTTAVIAADQALTGGAITDAVENNVVKPAVSTAFNMATGLSGLDVKQLAGDHPIMAAALGFGALNLAFGSDGIVGKMGMVVGLALLAWMAESMLGEERTSIITQSVTSAYMDGTKGDFNAAGNDLMRIFQPASSNRDAMISRGAELSAQQQAEWKRQLAAPTPGLVPN